MIPDQIRSWSEILPENDPRSHHDLIFDHDLIFYRSDHPSSVISINFWLLYHFFIFRSLCYTAIDFMTPIYYIVYSVASASDIDFLLMFYLVFLLPLWCGQNTLGFWPPSRIKLPDKRTRNYFIVERCSIISPFMGVKVASVRALSSILVVKDYIQWQNKSTQNYCCTIANISISSSFA